MKRLLFAGLILSGLTAQAQDTYLNDRLANGSNDVYGTSRYVGMGGAMGALGADLSCMSFNPAGIGLYRRSDIGFTAGALWDVEKVDGLKNSRATLDQFGAVYCVKTGSDAMPFFNLGFNYQKKLNYGSSFIADNNHLKELSQMDQLAELASDGFGTDYNLPGAAEYYEFLTPVTSADGKEYSINKFGGELNRYTHSQWGGLKAFDINLSGNVQDRFYFGITAGLESMNYNAETDYYEENSFIEDGVEKLGDYSLYNNYDISGWGFNMKFGIIVRPLEYNSLRIGLAMETPTWYQLNSSTLYQLKDEVTGIAYHPKGKSMDEAFLDYSLRTPIKGRLSIGSSIGSVFLWDIDYEYANYSKTSMGYPKVYNSDGTTQLFNNEPDRAMNKQTSAMLKGMHTVRAGIEVKPTSALALRLGYNHSTSCYANNVTFDQYNLDSYAMDYSTSTSYMKMGAVNTLTLGLGFKHKKFYADLAYKIRNQKADFYAFDCSFTDKGTQFTQDNPGLANVKLDPVETNLTRQQITATLGFKF